MKDLKTNEWKQVTFSKSCIFWWSVFIAIMYFTTYRYLVTGYFFQETDLRDMVIKGTWSALTFSVQFILPPIGRFNVDLVRNEQKKTINVLLDQETKFEGKGIIKSLIILQYFPVAVIFAISIYYLILYLV